MLLGMSSGGSPILSTGGHPNRIGYRPEIDGLRAIAVIPVILFHAGVSGFGGGFIGVDVFFVISGYLITSLLIADLQEGKFSIIRFYERRSRRILPALFVVMAASIPFAYAWMLPTQLEGFGKSLIAVVLFASNILFWDEVNYFEVEAELKPLLHTWSLAVEEQYYVFFPLFMFIGWRFYRKKLPALVFAIAIGSLLLSEWAWRHAPQANFYLTPTRAWELLIGSLCAYIQLGKPQRHSHSLAGIGIALILVPIFVYSKALPFPSLYALPPTIGVALVILFGPPATLVGRVLSMRPLVGIGLISYSAYLWHQPLIAFARIRSNYGELSGLSTAALIAASLILAYCSWRFVEKPFRSKSFPIRRLTVILVSCATLFILIGFALTRSHGAPSRYASIPIYAGEVGQAPFFGHISGRYFPCTPADLHISAPRFGGLTRCFQSKAGVPVDLALIGDSHAEHLFPGFTSILGSKNVAYYIGEALPVRALPPFDRIYDHVANNPSIRTVVIASYWSPRIARLPRREMFVHELEQTVSMLLSHGKSVYLVADAPAFRVTAEKCKYRGISALPEDICAIPAEEYLDREKGYLPDLEAIKAKYPAVEIIKLGGYFCDSRMCRMYKKGGVLFQDMNHFNHIGSEIVARNIMSDHPDIMR